ncbi:MAG: hypothetical protein NDJ92_13500, partial [Thermoanaerobaculia bacterium]|nr:hypothetical protein [Thermoanaerobaculia bacterium]
EAKSLESDQAYEEVHSRARVVGELCEKIVRELNGHEKSNNAGDFYQILTLLHDLDRELEELGGDALAIWAWSSAKRTISEDESRIWNLHLNFAAELSLLDATFAILLWDMGNLIEGKPLHLPG